MKKLPDVNELQKRELRNNRLSKLCLKIKKYLKVGGKRAKFGIDSTVILLNLFLLI
jgi:hypothetical protein